MNVYEEYLLQGKRKEKKKCDDHYKYMNAMHRVYFNTIKAAIYSSEFPNRPETTPLAIQVDPQMNRRRAPGRLQEMLLNTAAGEAETPRIRRVFNVTSLS